MFSKKEWSEANRDKVRLYSLRYRLRKKGMDLPPETLAEFEALREAKKAATRERNAARVKKWTAENRDKINARYRERLATDAEFREKEYARRAKNKTAKVKVRVELTPQEKEDKLRRRREAQAKSAREARARARAERALKEPKEKPVKEPVKKPYYPDRKPGRLLALMGWRGF